MNRNIKTHEQVKKEIEDFKMLVKNDPDTAKIVARIALIKTGVLNKDGSSKDHIVDFPHIGFESKSKQRTRK